MRDAVVIVGDGPAGRAVAAACAQAGLPAVLVGRDPGRPWHNIYGAWLDELSGLELRGAVGQRYDAPRVRTDRIEWLPLGRAYAVLDNEVLQQRLRDRAAGGGGREVAAVARSVQPDADGSVVHLVDGRTLPAGVVVDASGHRPALTERGARPVPAWQTAYGVVGRFEPAPVPPATMDLMDWRAVPGAASAVPTFCYTLDLGDGVTLVEETALAARPARPLGALRERLERRLAASRIRVAEQVRVERVCFPMGGAVPPPGQRVVPYGAAAGMVHPATGFQVAAALASAPALASALADAMAIPRAAPAEVVRAGWQAVWPRDRLRQRALHSFGLEVLLGFDGRGLQRFFEAFFSLPTPLWSAYVSGAPAAGDVARIMLAVASRLPLRLRAAMVGHALGVDGARLVRGLVSQP